MKLDSIPLTEAQRVQMRASPDWVQMTPEQADFVREAPEGHVCLLYDSDMVRMPIATLVEVHHAAFEEAAMAATKELGLKDGDDFDIEVEPGGIGRAYLRVTVVSGDRRATAVGTMPDPRSVH